MLRKTLVLFSAFILIAGCKSVFLKGDKRNTVSNKPADSLYSVWQIKNKADELYLYESAGQLKGGKVAVGDAYKWIIESAGEYALMRNKATGHYIYFDGMGSNVQVDNIDATAHVAEWKFGGFDYDHRNGCGWYWIENRNKPGAFLVSHTSEASITAVATNTNSDSTAHWSFIRVEGSELPFKVESDKVSEASFLGNKQASWVSDYEIRSNYSGKDNTWVKTLDISRFPQLRAPNDKLFNALYNMALEESLLDIRKSDSTFMAGKLWPDTWTRDIVYSIYLAYANILPEISKRTLEKQSLKNPDEALQDTGSGGSWPISTDRVSWAIAAWEYYVTTGDKQWLEECYNRLRYTAEKDLHVAFNKDLNLFAGETCSMDWRTHTYPNWFTNANIGESYSTGTNSLHAFMYFFLSEAATVLHKPEEETSRWKQVYNSLKNSINKVFWMDDKGYYSSYILPELYGYRRSERTAGMDNGLAIILGVADENKAKKIAQNFPLYPYGAATLYPSIPDDYAYHNKAIWPVWETYFMLGAKKAGNTKAVEHIMQSLIRESALFLTNKENMNYETGYNANTALNSDRQLWSVASYLGMVYRVVFGMEFTMQGITFHPLVPDLLKGPFELTNFKYRNAVLNIKVTGNGNEIASLSLDGKMQALPFIFPPEMNGNHKIEITMKKNATTDSIHLVKAGEDHDWTPAEPTISLSENQIIWKQIPDLTYRLWDGQKNSVVASPYKVDLSKFGTYNVYAVDAKGFASDVSNPVVIAPDTKIYEAEDAGFSRSHLSNKNKGYSGNGYVMDWDSASSHLKFTIDVQQDKEGNYALQLRGANGHGPHGTYVAIRSVFVDGKDAGTFILQANGNWSEWMQSNTLILKNLNAGEHIVEIKFNPENKGWDNNMSHGKEDENDCAIDYLKVMRLE